MCYFWQWVYFYSQTHSLLPFELVGGGPWGLLNKPMVSQEDKWIRNWPGHWMLSEMPCGLEQKGVKGAGAARGSRVRTHRSRMTGREAGPQRRWGQSLPKWERFSSLKVFRKHLSRITWGGESGRRTRRQRGSEQRSGSPSKLAWPCEDLVLGEALHWAQLACDGHESVGTSIRGERRLRTLV